ncbi:MAG: hypothetical protein QOJ54_817 [Aliidongia sp.]|nr:hypothetical protein [Aliidongia sp.]
MTTDPECTASRFETNMAALHQHFPIVYAHLAGITQPTSQITGSIETGDLNLDLGHTTLYTPDAVGYAETQLDRFRASPSRFYLNAPDNVATPYQQQHFIAAALFEYGRNRTVAERPAASTEGGGFLLVYGIGLGCHLPALFDEVEVRHVILIEEHLEFLYQSMHLHDWATIFENLAERGQSLRFVFGGEPRQVAAQVHWYIRGQGFGLIDGSYIFRHYSSMMLDKAYEEFTESLSLLSISIGFFEDELTMLTNCGTNLTWFDYRLLDDRPRVEIDLPAIIVGSGPSLDKSIEILKGLRDHAIIFSCGSSLRPLLKAGIRPDFHCELENSWQAFRSVWHVTEELGYDLDGITLIASTTVCPDLLPLFKQRILYFRDSVSSTGLWGPDQIGIFGTAPTCTNLALRAATLLSFKELYLFGVDMGTRDPSQHHSKAAIYYNDARWTGVLENDPHNRMSIELPGNFGGKAYTSTILHWARMMMGQGIESFSFSKIFNCSDGVAIPGTIPKLPASIRVTAPPERKRIILARIERSMDLKAKRELVPLTHLKGARVAFADYYDRMIATLDEALAEATPFVAFYEAMAEYLRERGENPFQITLRSVNIGTLMMSFQIAYYFVRRVPETEEPAVMAVYLKVLRERLVKMKAMVDEIFARLEAAHADDRTVYTVEGRDYAI